MFGSTGVQKLTVDFWDGSGTGLTVLETAGPNESGNTTYILNGQKWIKNDKICPFWRLFENLKLAVKQCYQTDQL